MSTHSIIDLIGRILESSDAKKALLIPYFLSILTAQLCLFALYFSCYPSAYINSALLTHASMPVIVVLTGLILFMLLLGHRVPQSGLLRGYIPYLFSFILVSILTFLGYLIGSSSAVVGVALTAVPLVAIVLFRRSVVVFILLYGALCLTLVDTLYIFDITPYAPLFTLPNVMDQPAKLFYSVSIVFFIAPQAIVTFWFTYHLIKYWRHREADAKQISLTDSLVNIANRRAISESLTVHLYQKRSHQPLSIILVDVDYFKTVNDRFGHMVGDIVLCAVARNLQSTLRTVDHIGRYGGEEFLIILPDTTLKEACSIAERCRSQLESEAIEIADEASIHITGSFGVFCSQDAEDSFLSVIQQVDTQLYRAKETGRNKVCSPI